MANMKSLIIGLGEVGSALEEILCKAYSYDVSGITEGGSFGELDRKFDILHVCIPFSNKFEEIVKQYQKNYPTKYTVIHSTVPVGTSRRLNAIHSAIRGIHPNLVEGILTFPKFLAGKQASMVADYFRKAGIKVILFDQPETSEAAKLFDTEYYRHCIEFTLEVKKYCNEHNLNFSEVYTIPNQTYNEGYTKLGHPEYIRSVLQPIMKEIGGHCVGNNKKLLKVKL